MQERVTLRVHLELLSDAIFSSGYSIPGGEDIAVCQDEAGYPYLKGSTLKGLLRESVENLLAWTGASRADSKAIFGESDWNGISDLRRIQLTGMYLDTQPAFPEECYAVRAFTSLENGVAKSKTLRTASCIRRGMCFSGTITCHADDTALLKQAFQGIKWAGTMRSRGFGQVRFTLGEVVPQAAAPTVKQAQCLRYRLETRTPAVITDLRHSYANGYDTYTYIPGSAVRGMVMSRLAERAPDWFAAHKTALLGSGTRFLDAVPDCGGQPSLPAVMGFYGEKGSDRAVSVLCEDVAGKKRVNLGDRCTLNEDTVYTWRCKTGGALRIQRRTDGKREDTKLFQTRYIESGQRLEGYILLDDASLSEQIAAAFGAEIWIGADRYEGFGQCAVTALEAVAHPDWYSYGYRTDEKPEETLYLLAMSPLTMLDANGEPCGLEAETLAAKMGVERVEVQACSTSLREFGGYNRIWGCGVAAMQMYDRGSIFKIKATPAPSAQALHEVQRTGLGIRKAEGFGQVLFLRPAQYENISRFAASEQKFTETARKGAMLRRARYQWIMNHCGVLHKQMLSPSQLGTIQQLCEKAIARGGDLAELNEHLQHNLEKRGAAHGERFKLFHAWFTEVMRRPLSSLLEVECEDTVTEKLKLLCLLLDFSRKEGTE